MSQLLLVVVVGLLMLATLAGCLWLVWRLAKAGLAEMRAERVSQAEEREKLLVALQSRGIADYVQATGIIKAGPQPPEPRQPWEEHPDVVAARRTPGWEVVVQGETVYIMDDQGDIQDDTIKTSWRNDPTAVAPSRLSEGGDSPGADQRPAVALGP